MVRYHNVTGIESFSLLYFRFFGLILLNFTLVFFSRQKKPRFITLPYSSLQDCSQICPFSFFTLIAHQIWQINIQTASYSCSTVKSWFKKSKWLFKRDPDLDLHAHVIFVPCFYTLSLSTDYLYNFSWISCGQYIHDNNVLREKRKIYICCIIALRQFGRHRRKIPQWLFKILTKKSSYLKLYKMHKMVVMSIRTVQEDVEILSRSWLAPGSALAFLVHLGYNNLVVDNRVFVDDVSDMLPISQT